ncbi:lipoprotein-releasing system transmembrane subunit LolC, partial [Candidatus Pelagibacter sp.]|nr:lipoprotein-releasing system transmembrane subunit LolC [Candidatus Pelagibacter sp.]
MKLKKFKFKKVKSTNNTAIRIIKETKYNLGMVVAENQVNGRGQYGRKWISSKGNLFISFFNELNKTKLSINAITKINCLLVKKSLFSFTSKKILFKKPNDFPSLEIVKNEKFKGNKGQLNRNYISIGNELSFSLDLKIGDELTLLSPSGVETIIGSMPKQKTFLVASIYNSGLAEFDNNIAFINLSTLEDFFDYKSEDRNLEIYLKNPNKIEQQKFIVQEIFDEEFVVSWADMNSSLFSALKVERNVMFIIL